MSARALRLAVFLAALVCTVGLILLTGSAAAGSPEAEPTCDGLTLRLSGYTGTVYNNSVTVLIDGESTVTPFAGDLTMTYAWDPAVGHEWRVSVDANRNGGPDASTFDVALAGLQVACTASSETSPVSVARGGVGDRPGSGPAFTIPPTDDPSVAVDDPPTRPDEMPATGTDTERTLGWGLTVGAFGFVLAGGVALARKESSHDV